MVVFQDIFMLVWSPKIMDLVAKSACGMCVEDALIQLQIIVKRSAKMVNQIRKQQGEEYFLQRTSAITNHELVN
ncbi:hypothetical protein Syun_030269 [Stephania yunnanensis]|uniref:Uncharacterized protein n=1 Tax=Stephania yunnanensis TaxID=152371 RepID=A0AAP0E9I2_9MAGN